MQQRKIVEDYLSSIIPDKIADSTKAELREEIEGHIYDKAEFYMEIGYDEETAFKKAVAEMGEAEGVKAAFSSIYEDSTLKGFMLFFGMCTINLLSVSWFGLGYWYFVEPSMHHVPNLIELTIFLAGFIFLTVHTIKCCRQKLHKQLTGMTAAYGLMAMGSFITSGLFYPILNAGYLVYCYITNGPRPEKDLAFPVNIIVLFVYALLSFLPLFKDYRFRTKSYRLSLKQITVILSVISVGFIAIYGFAYEKYERWYPDESKEEWYAETPAEYFLPNITTEQRNIYLSIKGGNKASETEKMLTENGFVKQKKNYEDFLWDCLFSYWIDDYLLEKNPENISGNKYSIYCYTNGAEDEDDYDDIISCIIISYDSNGKISYKLFIPNANGIQIDGYYQNYHHGEETQKWFENLRNGENCENTLECIKSTGAFIIEDEKYDEKSTVNTYKINLQCCYPLDTDFIDFLFGEGGDYMSYYYNFEIVAENGIITDFREVDEGLR